MARLRQAQVPRSGGGTDALLEFIAKALAFGRRPAPVALAAGVVIAAALEVAPVGQFAARQAAQQVEAWASRTTLSSAVVATCRRVQVLSSQPGTTRGVK